MKEPPKNFAPHAGDDVWFFVHAKPSEINQGLADKMPKEFGCWNDLTDLSDSIANFVRTYSKFDHKITLCCKRICFPKDATKGMASNYKWIISGITVPKEFQQRIEYDVIPPSLENFVFEGVYLQDMPWDFFPAHCIVKFHKYPLIENCLEYFYP